MSPPQRGYSPSSTLCEFFPEDYRATCDPYCRMDCDQYGQTPPGRPPTWDPLSDPLSMPFREEGLY